MFRPLRPRLLRGVRLPSPVTAPTITTARAVLRAHRMDDAEAWHRIHTQPETVRFLDWPTRDAAQARHHLRDRTRHTRLWQADDFLALAVEVDGRLAGDVSMHLRSVRPESRVVELGWLLDRAYTGRGLATEAVSALLDFAFTAVEARVALAAIAPDNAASAALADRLGFVVAHDHPGRRSHVLTSAAWAGRQLARGSDVSRCTALHSMSGCSSSMSSSPAAVGE